MMKVQQTQIIFLLNDAIILTLNFQGPFMTIRTDSLESNLIKKIIFFT